MPVVKNLPKEVEDFKKWCEANRLDYRNPDSVKEWCILHGKEEE